MFADAAKVLEELLSLIEINPVGLPHGNEINRNDTESFAMGDVKIVARQSE
jgi:hypothetical protein